MGIKYYLYKYIKNKILKKQKNNFRWCKWMLFIKKQVIECKTRVPENTEIVIKVKTVEY